ncbi:MAG: hypothetical protein V3T84_11065 [Phycisphaerales bacterium]
MRTLTILAFVCVACSPTFAQTMYSVRETDDTLVKIDISDPAAPIISDVGPLGVRFQFGGMTFGPGSELFMADGLHPPSLYTVNTKTGEATLVGPTGLDDLDAIAWDTSTRTMYGTQFVQGQALVTIDPATGEAMIVNPMMDVGIGGLTYNADTDQLVGSHNGPGDLYEIDRETGDLTLLFDGPFVNDSGLTYDPVNNFYWGIDWSGVLFYYDIAKGLQRTDLLTGLAPHDGLAWIPAPCPWDLDNSGIVGATDLLSLLVNWGKCPGCPADFDGNGVVGATDLLALLVNWGPCP